MEQNNKAKNKKTLIIVGAFLVVLILIGVAGGSETPQQNNNQDTNKQQKSEDKPEPKNEKSLADKVQEALDALGKDMKSTLASTSPEGYQGDITSVEPAAIDGTVKVNVSTYFEDSGDGIDGGQGIARRIFTNVCLDVPELNSLYVVSGSGLESKSVYRSDFPFCK